MHGLRLRLVAPLLVAALAGAGALAGCGRSTPKGPPALVFVSTRDGDYAIFGADGAGKHARRLTHERGDASTPAGLFFQIEPAWSPDGTRIAFVSRRDGRYHVYVMDADGSGTRRLTSSSKDDHDPAWSPDGSRIVFSREGALFGIPAAGGPATRVGGGFGFADHPAWSPDGSRIVYSYRRPGFQAQELWVVRADGTGARQLTHLGRTSASPAWSPDGRRIAFQSDAPSGHAEIFTVGANGSGARQVTQSDTDAIEPAWTPAGGLSYVVDGAIWLGSGGETSKLTSGGDNDSSPAWRPGGAK